MKPQTNFSALYPKTGDCVLTLFNRVLNTEMVPAIIAIIAMLYYKGDNKYLNIYRGIEMINHVTKLFTSSINERLYKWAEDCNVLTDGQEERLREGSGGEREVVWITFSR